MFSKWFSLFGFPEPRTYIIFCAKTIQQKCGIFCPKEFIWYECRILG